MHVFLDDAGDPGFKFGKGSSTHLVMAACVFREPADIRDAATRITMFKQGQRRDPTRELRFAKSSDRTRLEFLAAVAPANFAVRAISVDKRKIYSPHLRSNPSALKAYAIFQLLTHHFGTIHDAKLVIDGQDTKGFGMSDRAYLMRRVNEDAPGTLRAVEFADSTQNQMVQLADMVASAIMRNVRDDEKRDAKYFQVIQAKTYQPAGTLWRFQ